MIYFHLTTNFNYLIIIPLQKLLPVLVIVVSAVIAATPAMPSYEDVFVNGLFYNNNPLFTASVNKDMHYMILQSYNNRFKSDYISYTVLPFSISPKVFCLLYTYNIVPIILCQSINQRFSFPRNSSYSSRFLGAPMSWDAIRKLVSEMFTQQVN